MESTAYGLSLLPDAKQIFERLGGTALGLFIAQRISETIPSVTSPTFAAIPVEALFEHNKIPDGYLGALSGVSEAIVKLSGLQEAFSATVTRGANSSFGRPRISPYAGMDAGDLRKLLESSGDAGGSHMLRSVVLQQAIATVGAIGVISHSNGAELLVEFSLDGHRYLYASSAPGKIDHTESTLLDRSVANLASKFDVAALLEKLWRIQKLCDFPVNIEGVCNGLDFIILQLRPVPNDAPRSPEIARKIAALDVSRWTDVATTRLVWGVFDVKAKIESFESPLAGEKPAIVLAPKHPEPWNAPNIRERLEGGGETVVINTHGGFHLSHSHSDLPAVPLRNKYKVVSLPWLDPAKAVGKEVHLISDGEHAVFCATDGSDQDRKRTVVVKGRVVNFVQIESGFLPPLHKITSVAVVPFLPDGQMVAVTLSRGLDLPGGHVQKQDYSIEATARREAWEEAKVRLGEVRVARVIQSDYYGHTPAELTYMIIVVGAVIELGDFEASMEVSGREALSTENFIARYSAGDKNEMRKIIDAAKRAIGYASN